MSNDYSTYYGNTSSSYANTRGYWYDNKVIKVRARDEAGPQPELKIDFEAIKSELQNIAKEQEEDKEKHLPKFDPEDLDI